MIPLLVPIGLGLIGGYLTKESDHEMFAEGGSIGSVKDAVIKELQSLKKELDLNGKPYIKEIEAEKVPDGYLLEIEINPTYLQDENGEDALLISINDNQVEISDAVNDLYLIDISENDFLQTTISKFKKILQDYIDNQEYLIDKHGKISEEEEEYEEDEKFCVNCSGTGMGMYDGSSCIVCRGRGYAKGGGIKRKDLFETPEKMPKKVSRIIDRYWEEKGDDMDYEDTEKMLKEVQAVGYTFDYGLDNTPVGLRPINVDINELEGYEEYAKGGDIPYLYAPEGYVLVKITSHRSANKARNENIKYVSLWTIGKQYPASVSINFMSLEDYKKIKDIKGVILVNKLTGKWFARDEDIKLMKIFNKLTNKYAEGGYVNQYFAKGYENDAIIELKKALPNHTFEKGKNSIIVDGGKFIIHLDFGRYGFIREYNHEGSMGGHSVTKLDEAIAFIETNSNYAKGGYVIKKDRLGNKIKVAKRGYTQISGVKGSKFVKRKN